MKNTYEVVEFLLFSLTFQKHLSVFASFSVIIATFFTSVKTLRKHLKTDIYGLPLCCHKQHQIVQAFNDFKTNSDNKTRWTVQPHNAVQSYKIKWQKSFLNIARKSKYITDNLDHTAYLHFQFWWQQKDIFTTLTESNLKVLFERGCVIHIYIPEKYPNMLLWFCQTRLILCQKMRRGRFRILSTTKTVFFVTKVNSWKPLTVLTEISALDVAGVLNPMLTETCTVVMGMVLEHDSKWGKVKSLNQLFVRGQ